MLSKRLNGLITIHQGDAGETYIFANVGTELAPEAYELADDEYIYIGVMEPNQQFENALIRKKLDKDDEVDGLPGYYSLKFKYSDTCHVIPGTYYYEAKLLRIIDGVETIDTIIPKTKFIILE